MVYAGLLPGAGREPVEKPSLCLLHCLHLQCVLEKWRLPLLFLSWGSTMLGENKG